MCGSGWVFCSPMVRQKKTMYSTCKPNKFKGSLCNKMTPDKIVAGGGQKKWSKIVQNNQNTRNSSIPVILSRKYTYCPVSKLGPHLAKKMWPGKLSWGKHSRGIFVSHLLT